MRWKVIVCFSLIFLNCSVEAGHSFPEEKSLKSSDGRYIIFWREPSSEADMHHLYIQGSHDRQEWELHKFPRHADVEFSTLSRFLYINDWEGSNQADCYAVDVQRQEKRSMRSFLLKLPQSRSLTKNIHNYVSCKKWIDSNTVEIEISAYGNNDKNGVRYKGRYNWGTSVMQLDSK